MSCLHADQKWRSYALFASISWLIAPVALAGDCSVFPGGEFENGLKDWTFEASSEPGEVGTAEVSFSIVDESGYVGASGAVPAFDDSVLQIDAFVLAEGAGVDGVVSADASISREVIITGTELQVVRGGTFLSLSDGAGFNINVILTVQNESGTFASLNLYNSFFNPSFFCFVDIFFGTLDIPQPVFSLDLADEGFEVGETVTVTIFASASIFVEDSCGVTDNSVSMLLDDFSFCGVPVNPFDLDSDGVVGFNDLLILLAAWGDCPTGPADDCPADLDGAGGVGFSDLLLLLANWDGAS